MIASSITAKKRLENPESTVYWRVEGWRWTRPEVRNKLRVAETLLCHPEMHEGRARTQAVDEYTSARLYGFAQSASAIDE